MAKEAASNALGVGAIDQASLLRPVMRRVLVALYLLSLVAFEVVSCRLHGFEDLDEGPYALEGDEEVREYVYPYGGDNEAFSSRWTAKDGEYLEAEDSDSQPSMMDTFEKFKRQAVKSVVPGDEPAGLGESLSPFSKLNSMVSWQTATLISVLCVGAVVIGVILGVVYWPKTAFGECRESSDVNRRAGIGSNVTSAGDRSLAHSAQMYHYQQQKQQMLAIDQAVGKVRNLDSNSDSEGDSDEPDVNVYECPGLAAPSEHEVKNPMFEEGQGQGSGASSAKESK